MSRFKVEIELEIEVEPGTVLNDDGNPVANPTENELSEFIDANRSRGFAMSALSHRGITVIENTGFDVWFRFEKRREEGDTDE